MLSARPTEASPIGRLLAVGTNPVRFDVRWPRGWLTGGAAGASGMLQRRLGLLQAVSLNMSMMVGIGPFITIPTLLGTMGGPQAMLGWILGGLVALGDGMVWSELAAAFPGSGGTYHFYDAVYGECRAGRLLKFLFVWQFLFSGPLEVATGRHRPGAVSRLLLPRPRPAGLELGRGSSPACDGAVSLGPSRRDGRAGDRRRSWPIGGSPRPGRLMVVLWAGMLVTVAWVIATGLTHFDAARAFDFPERAWHADRPLVRSAWDGAGRSRCTISSATTRSATWATRSPTRPARSPARS